MPEPVENLFAIQDAKLKLARLGADYLVYPRRARGRRADGARVRGAARAPQPGRGAVYSTGNREITFRTDEFSGATRLVDAILDARQAA